MINKNIAYYCSGNFTDFFYYSSKKSKHNSFFILQNFKGLEFLIENNVSSEQFLYQYECFNEIYECEKYADFDVNYFTIYSADKSHFKKINNGKKIKNIINTFLTIFDDFLISKKPDFVFFPIIESLDGMALYELCQLRGVSTIVNSHARILPFSYLSDTKYETFPEFFFENDCENDRLTTESFMSKLVGKNERLSNQMLETVNRILHKENEIVYIPKYQNAIVRLLKNIKYKHSSEKYNYVLSNFIKFQVYFERIFVSVQLLLYKLIEILILKPISLRDLNDRNFNFFPLHFSPESSINTPSPYYIDQERVVDKILLESQALLVIREHPALYGKRAFRFYLNMIKKPNVVFCSIKDNIFDFISNASCVYTVTGTVALECFFKNVKYHQYGINYLSHYLERKGMAENLNRNLVNIIINNCDEFLVVPHSNRNLKLNSALFSSVNIYNFNKALDKHVEKISSRLFK